MHLYLFFAVPALLIAAQFLIKIYHNLFSPLASVPGPFLARFTDLWYAWRINKGHFEWDNISLHRKYGRQCHQRRISYRAIPSAMAFSGHLKTTRLTLSKGQSSGMALTDTAYAPLSLPKSFMHTAMHSQSRLGTTLGATQTHINGPSSQTGTRSVTVPIVASTRACTACLR